MNIDLNIKVNILKMLAEARPDLWQKCYPKRYAEVTGGEYGSVKEVASSMMGAAMKIEDGFKGENEKAEIVWASKLANYRVPVYWLSSHMAEALKLTTPPHTINVSDMKLPFEAACFMLPRGTLVHDDSEEGEASFISYVRTSVGEEIRSLTQKGGPVFWHPLRNGALSVYAHTTAEHLMHWTIPDTDPVDLGHLDEWIQTFADEQYRHKSEAPQFCSDVLTDADNKFMARVMHLVFGTLILMTSRPDLVKTGSLDRKVQKKGQAPVEFWTPNRIGEHYRLRYISEPKGGTHASPRFHWVRGFYREQAWGEKHSLRKEIWVEPFVRGGE